ncbi:hypothetical protein GW17_00034196, partial [Ensete ventricosum]
FSYLAVEQLYSQWLDSQAQLGSTSNTKQLVGSFLHLRCKRTDGSCIPPPPVFPPGEEAERLKCYYLLSEVEFLGTSSTEHESARLQSVSWDLLVASTLAEAFMSRDRP